MKNEELLVDLKKKKQNLQIRKEKKEKVRGIHEGKKNWEHINFQTRLIDVI